MKPLFSYYGGKQRIATAIIPHLPPHTVYTEPFAGCLAVLFAKGVSPLRDCSLYREAVNDRDERIINLYRVAREQPEEFERLIKFTPYSQSEHKRAIEIGRDPNATEVDRAWAEYVGLNMSFAHQRECGWRVAVTSQNEAVTWDSRRIHVPTALDRLSAVHFGCEDALDFIRRWDSPQTCHYVDPPYPGTEQGHYGGYTEQDFADLCDLLDTCEGSFVLSNYPHSIPDTKGWRRVDIKATCSASGRGKVGKATRSRAATAEELGDRERTECLWIVDRSANVRPDLQSKLWHPGTGRVGLGSPRGEQMTLAIA